MQTIDWGIIDYPSAWKRQEELFNKIIAEKKGGISTQELNTLVFCEHPHVYTLGKSGDEHNLLLNEEKLTQLGITFHRTNRGGDITYHGPGQIVGYPILNLEDYKLSLKNYIYTIEEVIIRTLADEDINSERLEGATGVWLDSNTSKARKICAIGVKASRFVTMHGFALNVNTDLEYYRYINPCGFVDKGVTSMQKELGQTVDIEKIKRNIEKHFQNLLNLKN